MSKGKPTHLYHYTSAEGLKGIVENRRIWASDIFSLNDWEEFFHGRDAAERDLDKLLADALGKDCQTIQWIKNEISQITVGMSLHTYVCSFSEEQDDLGQWRAYCPRGGFAIGFPFARLRELTRENDSHFSLKRCTYRKEERNAIIKTVVEDALKQKQDAYTKLLANAGDQTAESAIRCALSGALKWQLFEVCPTIKNKAFEGEKEWRLISAPRSDNYKNSRKFRIRDGLTIPYLEFPLNDADLWSQVEVCVGPSPYPEEANKFARMLLLSGLEKKALPTGCVGRVRNSKVPYRYW